jgi:aminoglycoside phosphotransferase (APT) family kinase protein
MSTSDIDVSAIIASLNIGPVTSIAPVTGGADTAIWRVEHDRTVSALRVLRLEQAPVAVVEQIAMRAASVALPVPEIRAVTTWSERPVMLIEWMRGEPLLLAVMRDADHPAKWGRLLGAAQATLHEIPAPAGLPDASASWLGRLSPELPAGASGTTLLHFDFHPLNVLVDNGELSGVIDWSNAASGDPRLDAARTWAILESAPVELPGLGARGSRHLLSEFSRGWREAYEEKRGPLAEFEPFTKWALIATSRDLTRSRPGKGTHNEPTAGIGDGLKILT